MNRGVVVRTFVAFLFAAAVLAVPGTAQAVSVCLPGFDLTSGGVPEADLNGDLLTCELTIVDPVTGDLTILALDNAPADPASTQPGCPGGNSGFVLYEQWTPNAKPDRNGNGKVCIKHTPCPPGPFCLQKSIIIDDHVPKN